MNVPTADQLNTHLSQGGRVQVTTYLRSTLYDRRHAGWFSQGAKSGFLYVQHGRSKNCLSGSTGLLVSIRLL